MHRLRHLTHHFTFNGPLVLFRMISNFISKSSHSHYRIMASLARTLRPVASRLASRTGPSIRTPVSRRIYQQYALFMSAFCSNLLMAIIELELSLRHSQGALSPWTSLIFPQPLSFISLKSSPLWLKQFPSLLRMLLVQKSGRWMRRKQWIQLSWNSYSSKALWVLRSLKNMAAQA